MRRRPRGGEAEGQVLGAEVLQGTTCLGGHRLGVVAGERQGGPGAGYLPDEVAGLLVEFDALQRALGRLQPLLDPRGLRGHQRQRGPAHPQPGSGVEHRSGQGGQPVEDGHQHAAQVQVHAVAVDQALGALHVAGQRRVTKGLQQLAVVFAPFAGPDVQLGDLLRREALSEPLAQQVAEEVVVAVPAPLVVEGDDEQVGALDAPAGSRRPEPAGERRTASHRGPHRRSRMEVRSRKAWTSAGCRCRTSSSR